jgi:peptide/nickel transport system permease protein
MRAIKILERIVGTIPVMFGVAIIVFFFIRLTPGDPVDIMLGHSGTVSQREIDQLRQQFHLDKPLGVQLWYFLSDAAQGNLGYSYVRNKSVVDLLAERLPATIEMTIGALLVSLIVAVPIGILSAIRQNSLLDRLSMAGAFLGISMPGFWLGIILILLFAVQLQWLPAQGRLSYEIPFREVTGFYVLDSILTGNMPALKDSLLHLVLPSVTLGLGVAAIIARVLRSSMLEVLRSDYIKLARAKGATEWNVVLKHALRNALIPTITVVGLQVGTLLGGNMIVETVFSWPGLGRLVVDAIFNRDFPLIQGAVMIYAITFVLTNLAVDVLYTYLNPRITM